MDWQSRVYAGCGAFCFDVVRNLFQIRSLQPKRNLTPKSSLKQASPDGDFCPKAKIETNMHSTLRASNNINGLEQ
jgi:hypothetical protein